MCEYRLMEANTTTQTEFVVRGVNAEGDVKYYTGRVSDENGGRWLSADINEAFAYAGIEAARNRAAGMNKMTAIHGWRFMVPTAV
jgi:hypothetical protein